MRLGIIVHSNLVCELLDYIDKINALCDFIGTLTVLYAIHGQ